MKEKLIITKLKKTLAVLDNKLAKLLKEGQELRAKEFSNIREKMFAMQVYNSKLQQIRIEYKKIRDLFSVCKENNIAKNAKIMTTFLQQMEALGTNKGFDRIVGYDDIKNDLKNKFILDIVLQDKISDKADVSNAILFYGPTGNGKSTFAKALAEQALMDLYVVNAAGMSDVDAMNLIEHYAKESKKTFEVSDDKKRSVVIVDEVDLIVQDDSPVLNRFKKLINNCAEKYNCTLFLTTNNPLDLPEEFLSKSITPFKIPVALPDDITAKNILDKKLKQAGCLDGIDTKAIVEKMFSNPTRKYSNGDISKVVETVLFIKEKPITEDFLSFVYSETHQPTIRERDLKKFQQERKRLNK